MPIQIDTQPSRSHSGGLRWMGGNEPFPRLELRYDRRIGAGRLGQPALPGLAVLGAFVGEVERNTMARHLAPAIVALTTTMKFGPPTAASRGTGYGCERAGRPPPAMPTLESATGFPRCASNPSKARVELSGRRFSGDSRQPTGFHRCASNPSKARRVRTRSQGWTRMPSVAPAPPMVRDAMSPVLMKINRRWGGTVRTMLKENFDGTILQQGSR